MINTIEGMLLLSCPFVYSGNLQLCIVFELCFTHWDLNCVILQKRASRQLQQVAAVAGLALGDGLELAMVY